MNVFLCPLVSATATVMIHTSAFNVKNTDANFKRKTFFLFIKIHFKFTIIHLQYKHASVILNLLLIL